MMRRKGSRKMSTGPRQTLPRRTVSAAAASAILTSSTLRASRAVVSPNGWKSQEAGRLPKTSAFPAYLSRCSAALAFFKALAKRVNASLFLCRRNLNLHNRMLRFGKGVGGAVVFPGRRWLHLLHLRINRSTGPVEEIFWMVIFPVRLAGLAT